MKAVPDAIMKSPSKSLLCCTQRARALSDGSWRRVAQDLNQQAYTFIHCLFFFFLQILTK
jgi:hypothetical protein